MTLATPLTLAELSREVAARFLQSVVVVDDQAQFPGTSVPTVPDGERVEQPGDAERPMGNLRVPEGTDELEGHGLNAKELIDGFANKGLVCAVLKTGAGAVAEDETRAVALKASGRADIVIMDWVVDGQYGEMAMDLIRSILSSDQASGRFRLIVIYTGEPALQDIRDRIGNVLDEFYQDASLDRSVDFEARKGPVNIVIYAKEGARIPAEYPEARRRIVAVGTLPETVMDVFGKMIIGMLPNVAIAALGALREQTYMLLSKFDQALDPAYLAHRILLPQPNDAEAHLVSMLAAELRSILEQAQVGRYANAQAGRLWVDYQKSRGVDFQQSDETLVYLLEKGIEDRDTVHSRTRWSKSKLVTRAASVFFAGTPTGNHGPHVQLAKLMSLRTRYSESQPQLSLGTIVAMDKPPGLPEYYFCIQPRCDSTRLEGATPFPFLRLTLVRDISKSFELVVHDRDDVRYFTVPKKGSALWIESFDHDDGREVTAQQGEGGLGFQTEDGKRFYRWVAELKEPHAQRVANKFASELSRVGLDESEWVRQSGR